MALVCSSPIDERWILETPVSRAGLSSLVGGCWEGGSRSFLCLWFVVSQLVMPAELFISRSRMRCREDVWLCMCESVWVVLIIIICQSCSPFCNVKNYRNLILFCVPIGYWGWLLRRPKVAAHSFWPDLSELLLSIKVWNDSSWPENNPNLK